MTTDGNYQSVAEVFGSLPDEKKGGGGPAGTQACARAILTGTQSDDKWAAATLAWDKIRGLIRKLPREQEIAAWQLAYDAMTELRADLEQQFFDNPEGVDR